MPNSRARSKAAVQDSIRAREDRERTHPRSARPTRTKSCRERAVRRERRRQDAEAYREQVDRDAEGESDRFTQILGEYEKAPGVTRERLYIETLEEILRTRPRCSSTPKAATTCCICRSISSSQRRSARRPPSRCVDRRPVPHARTRAPRSRERDTTR